MLKYLDKKGLNWQEEIKNFDDDISEDNQEGDKEDDKDDAEAEDDDEHITDEEQESNATPKVMDNHSKNQTPTKEALIIKDHGSNMLA